MKRVAGLKLLVKNVLVITAVFINFLSYPVTGGRLQGIPVPYMAWELSESGEFWMDFVSPLSFPIIVLDIILCSWLGMFIANKLMSRLFKKEDNSPKNT